MGEDQDNHATAAPEMDVARTEGVEQKTNASKYFPEFQKTIASQTGKVVVITGTTSGTGKVAAITSLDKGATVALLNRNLEKAEASLSTFLDSNPEARERVHFVKCDLQDFESVTAAAEELKKLFSEEGIDVLSNNAGVMALADEATKDGFDVQMQTNHLSHFLLTKELFPLLKHAAEKRGEARVVSHSSTARLWPPGFLKKKYFQKKGGNLGGNGNSLTFGGGRWKRYHQTKLANAVFTQELQKRCSKAGVKVKALCAHPGISQTELFNTADKNGGMASMDILKNSQTPEDGAMGLLRGMFDPTVKAGKLYGPSSSTGKATERSHGVFATSSGGKLLWRESENACGEFDVSA